MAVPHGIDRSGAAGGTGAQGMTGSLNDLTDPGADRILFWDDSETDLKFLSLGTGLSITGTSMALHANLVTLLGLSTADGNFIVGDGATWVVESGATARASLGIAEVTSPTAQGDFVIGETASNPISIPFAMAGSPLINGRVNLSVAASALTITLLGHDNAAASASNPVFVRMPQGNPLDGTYVLLKTTTNLTLTVSLGSTLGTTNGATTPLYVYLLDNSGTPELAISATYYGQQSVRSTTAEGGAGGADGFATIYSTTGRTSVPLVPILKWDCAQTSAGVWLSVTGEKQLAPLESRITLGVEQATTSGTAIDFTGIPAGVRRITISFVQVSTDGTSPCIVQLGDSGGIETTGYSGAIATITAGVAVTTVTSGMHFARMDATTNVANGSLILTLENAASNRWCAVSCAGLSDSSQAAFAGYSKSLSGVLSQVRVTTLAGTANFDLGLINISYE